MTNENTGDSVTYQAIVDAMNKLGPPPIQSMAISNAYKFAGLNVIEAPQPQQKIKLSDFVDVSPEYRRGMDSWLAAEFGFQDPLLEKNKMLISPQFGFAVMHRKSISMLNDLCC